MSTSHTQSALAPALERGYFEALRARLLGRVRGGEHLLLNLSGEASQFVRINGGKVRQIGTVEDLSLEITLLLPAEGGGARKGVRALTLTGISYLDHEQCDRALEALRAEVAELPPDPFAKLPEDFGASASDRRGSLVPIEEAPRALLEPVSADIDVVGIYAAGPVVRAMASSAGTNHWFSTETFSFDYSLYTKSQRAVKATFAGQSWDEQAYRAEIERSRQKLALLERPARKVQRGRYRVFLEPGAVSELINMLSWGGVSEAAIRQGDSPLRLLRSGERKLSPLFQLSEDFSSGATPRFNEEGELSPEILPLIRDGKLANSLVSARSSKEYGVPSNGAGGSETLRSPSLAAGTLPASDALARLGTGLHLSALHYLNWSDQPGGRITGMTRYACFWVENGQIVAPIENLRWDDSIFSLFGAALEGLTRERTFIPAVGTYGGRSLGGEWVPGMLLSGMEFTL